MLVIRFSKRIKPLSYSFSAIISIFQNINSNFHKIHIPGTPRTYSFDVGEIISILHQIRNINHFPLSMFSQSTFRSTFSTTVEEYKSSLFDFSILLHSSNNHCPMLIFTTNQIFYNDNNNEEDVKKYKALV